MEKRAIVLSGMCDAALVLALPIGAVLATDFGGRSVWSLFVTHWEIYATLVVPFALVAAWRGVVHTRRLLNGHRDLYRSPFEGFVVGFAPIFLWLMGNAGITAIATGNVWDGAASWGVAEWWAYTLLVGKLSLICGACGAAVATGISGVNRLIVGRYQLTRRWSGRTASTS